MDLPSETELAVGERWQVQLPGLGSAGYQWVYELTEGLNVVAVSLEPGPPPANPPAGGEPPGSGDYVELLEVQALRPGTATLHLKQQRSWEIDKPPLHAHTIRVVVTAVKKSA